MGRKKSMEMILLAVMLTVSGALPVTAASPYELTPYLGARYFTWEEYRGGRRLLKESGPLFAGGVLIEVITPSSLALRGKEELFGGIVDYDGETQSLSPVPVKTDVSYVGTGQDLDLGYRYSADTWYLEPFSGLGYRWWLRGLRDAASAAGQRVSGYTEYWQTGYARLGLRGSYRPAPVASLFAEGGAKYPFYTSNSVDFAGAGVNSFRPAGKWSGFAETGVTYRRLKLALSYEGFRYSSSPVVQVGTQRYLQPESSSDIFGLNLGWAFK